MSDPQAAGGDSNQPGGQAEDPAKAGQPGAPGANPPANPEPTKPAEGAKDEGKAGELELKAPEGVAFDEARLTEFKAIAKELKLDQPTAQRLADWEAKRLQGQADAHVAMVKGWLDEVKADKELGGAKFDESVATARKAIDLGPPELKALLNETGLGNHPVIVRWAHTIGKKLSEDTIEKGATGGAGVKSAAQVLYGESSKS